MLQMAMKSGDNKEQILDLVDVPEFVLVQSCDIILRHQDLRNPDAQYMLRETVNALKVKAEEKPSDLVFSYNRYDLKEYIVQIENLLSSVAQADMVNHE